MVGHNNVFIDLNSVEMLWDQNQIISGNYS